MISVVQLMDHGVTKRFMHMHFYRLLVVQNILSRAYLDRHQKINIFQTARMCNSPWGQVITFFHKGGFCHTVGEVAREDVPTVENWEDVRHDSGVRYKDFLNMVKGCTVQGTNG